MAKYRTGIGASDRGGAPSRERVLPHSQRSRRVNVFLTHCLLARREPWRTKTTPRPGRLTGPRTTGTIRMTMRPHIHEFAVRSAAVLTIAALVQGGLIGMAMAVHTAHDHHELLGHDKSAAIGLIVHGHDHDEGTPEHEHAFVSAKPAPQHFERNELRKPPLAAWSAVFPWSPRISLSFRRGTALCGPSPPPLNRTLAVLRI